MKDSIDYQRFAEECRRLAQQFQSERQREILEEMAEAWDELANEAAARGTIHPS
jgi:hypothetical protein